MLEPLTAVTLASSVVQFVDFATKLCKRIDELSTAAGEAPGKIGQTKDRLSIVVETIDALDKDTLAAVDHEKKTIESCKAHVEELYQILDKFNVPEPKNSRWQHGVAKLDRSLKAFKSLRAEDKIEGLEKSLGRLLVLVNLQRQGQIVSDVHKVDKTGGDILSELKDLRLDLELKPTLPLCTPVCVLPFVRNPNFVGREELLSDIDRKFTSGQPRVALCGLGGVGKSQIALEYAFRVRTSSPQTSIFWIYANSVLHFGEAYSKIAASCNLPGRDEPQRNVIQLVKDWLELKYPFKWLMILDNVDSIEAFCTQEVYGKPLIDYIPQTATGSVLFTSRNRDVGVDLTFDREPIMIPSMDAKEAHQLFGKELVSLSTTQERRDLLNELDCLPLAVTQAVAYMTKSRKTVRQYLARFRQTDSIKIRLLRHSFNDHGREARQMESLTATFMVTFEYLKAEHSNAARLLSMMSFLDRQRISGYLLHPTDEEDLMDVEESIDVLMAFSFVARDESECHRFCQHDLDSSFFSMHRLVQLATKAWIVQEEREGGEIFASQMLQIMAQRAVSIEHDNVLCEHLREDVENDATHLRGLLNIRFVSLSTETQLSQASLHILCVCHDYRDDIVSARHHAAEALDIRRRILGLDHPDSCCSLAWLARCTHGSLGKDGDDRWGERDTEAAKLFRQALDGFYRSAEVKHVRTACCALMYLELVTARDATRDSEANELFQEILGRLDQLRDRVEESYAWHEFLSGCCYMKPLPRGQDYPRVKAMRRFIFGFLDRLETYFQWKITG